MKKLLFPEICILIFLTLGACAPKAPEISGRILFTDDSHCIDDKFNIYEFKAGMDSPALLWTIPCDSRRGSFFRSPNSRLLFLESDELNQRKIIDLTNGKVFPFPVPVPEPEYVLPVDGFGFSPDDRYFAYTENTYGPSRANLYLFDLQEGTTSLLFENPCASYKILGDPLGGGEYKCPELGKPAWLDSTSLVVNAYVGELPESSYWGDRIEPNATLVLGLDGQVLQQFQPMLHFWGVRGQTILFYIEGKGTSGYGWMDTAELKSGKLDLHPLDSRIDQFPQGYEGDVSRILYLDVASDGLSVFQRNLGFHLLGIRTSSDLSIPHAGISNCNGGLIWSPDLGSVLCFNYHKTLVLSLKGYAPQKLPTGSLYPVAWLP